GPSASRRLSWLVVPASASKRSTALRGQKSRRIPPPSREFLVRWTWRNVSSRRKIDNAPRVANALLWRQHLRTSAGDIHLHALLPPVHRHLLLRINHLCRHQPEPSEPLVIGIENQLVIPWIRHRDAIIRE